MSISVCSIYIDTVGVLYAVGGRKSKKEEKKRVFEPNLWNRAFIKVGKRQRTRTRNRVTEQNGLNGCNRVISNVVDGGVKDKEKKKVSFIVRRDE